LLAACLLAMPRPVSAQTDKKLTIRLEQQNLAQTLRQLQDASQTIFAFDETQLKRFTSNARQFTNESLSNILTTLLKETGYGFQSINGSIVISLKTNTTTPAKTSGKITGRILDEENGQPIASASIRAGDKGITSDSNGLFTLLLPPGKYDVSISAVGYGTQKITAQVGNDGQTVTLDIKLKREKGQLGEVVITADRVVTTSNTKLLNEIRKSTGVVSGISAEQITISVDRSATEVVRRVAGVSLQDGFITIRGMTPRYNPVYLNNTYLPSTDPNKRAFNFDLLPSNTIDRILVYKTAAPELPADFAGGVVKVYTKKALPVRRFELSINGQYRTDNKFFDNHATAYQGKYDWFGVDDGTRRIPANMPRDQYGQVVVPQVETVPNNYTKTNEVLTKAMLGRAAKTWNIGEVYHPADLLLDMSYYNYADLGKMRLNSVTVGRYENQRSYFRSPMGYRLNRYEEKEFPTDGSPLTPDYDDNYRLGYDSTFQHNVRLSLMEQLSLYINKNNEITLMGMFNRNTKEVLQINTITEFVASDRGSFFPRRIESAYNNQDIALGRIGGDHKLGNGRHTIEWGAVYSEANINDPNQVSNVYEVDDISTNNHFNGGGGSTDNKGTVNITDSTQWRLLGVTVRNTTIGRITDAEGKEKRKQANLDYVFRPFKKWEEAAIKAGFYYEDKNKIYSLSSLALKDYPVMNWGKTPWTHVGDSLLARAQQSNKPMHLQIQDAGIGGQTYGYEATFKNIAGYLAANIPLAFRWPFGKKPAMQIDIYGGVRLEYSERHVYTTTGKEIVEETGIGPTGQPIVLARAAEPIQRFILPSVSATWHITPQHQLRLAYGKTLNRPDLRELSPFVTYNPAEGFTYIGKPTLHDAHIDNYDLRWEYYPREGETISAGIYYKDLTEPIEEINNHLNTGNPGYAPSNLVFAKIKGAEIEVRKQLNFINGPIFEHLGIILNACYNITETNNTRPENGSGHVNYYPGGTTRPFIGAAPWIVNAGLFYDNKQAGTRISLQYNGIADRLLINTGDNVEQEPWIFEKSRSVLDLSILQKLTPWVSIRVAAQNLLNAPIKWYADGNFNKRYDETPSLIHTLLYNSPTTPPTKAPFIQGDYYYRNYKPGVYYTLGFQFNLQGKTKKASK
jgi:TonB-dependent receptor